MDYTLKYATDFKSMNRMVLFIYGLAVHVLFRPASLKR